MYIFLSYEINKKTPAYGGKKGFLSKKQSSIKDGDSANVSIWTFSNHLGTHIDYPSHFYEKGHRTNDYKVDFFIYKEKEIQLLNINLPKNELLILPEHITNNTINRDVEIIIIKTNSSNNRYKEEYWKYNPGISIKLSNWVRQKYPKLKIIGIDSISISSYQHRKIGRIVHKNLLNPSNPIILIEDLNLKEISKKTIFKQIIIAPFRVLNENGCPCTIIAEVK